jgi:hypothetical protein
MSIQHHTTSTSAGFSFCPPLTLDKLVRDPEMIKKLEEELKERVIKEKLRIEEETLHLSLLQKEREEWFNEAVILDKEVTYLKNLLMLCLCFSPLVLMVGFYLGKLAGT